MRIAVLVGALGLATYAFAANATPAAPSYQQVGQDSNIVDVAGGCGRGGHPNRWGRCVPNRYGYYRPAPYRYYRAAPYPYYGGGYAPRWGWGGSPSDHVANELNRRSLYGWGY